MARRRSGKSVVPVRFGLRWAIIAMASIGIGTVIGLSITSGVTTPAGEVRYTRASDRPDDVLPIGTAGASAAIIPERTPGSLSTPPSGTSIVPALQTDAPMAGMRRRDSAGYDAQPVEVHRVRRAEPAESWRDARDDPPRGDALDRDSGFSPDDPLDPADDRR